MHSVKKQQSTIMATAVAIKIQVAWSDTSLILPSSSRLVGWVTRQYGTDSESHEMPSVTPALLQSLAGFWKEFLIIFKISWKNLFWEGCECADWQMMGACTLGPLLSCTKLHLNAAPALQTQKPAQFWGTYTFHKASWFISIALLLSNLKLAILVYLPLKQRSMKFFCTCISLIQCYCAVTCSPRAMVSQNLGWFGFGGLILPRNLFMCLQSVCFPQNLGGEVDGNHADEGGPSPEKQSPSRSPVLALLLRRSQSGCLWTQIAWKWQPQ